MKKIINLLFIQIILASMLLCSFVKASNDIYNRPWTSPKKAIIGGAIYIAEGYINKGQFTSYLQKFNVNPNGYYGIYNHQYMTNIRAPYTEAKKSYDGLKLLGVLDLPLIFSIPIFLNMPEVTTLDGYVTNNNVIEIIEDVEFEILLELEDFPESYRRYLRVIHKKYPNFKFRAMHTDLDFYEAVSAQKLVGAIDNSTYYDSSMSFVETGWFMPTIDATAYFLDPRNFLNEERILMFEMLDYSDVYTETMVASILKNTHMGDYSLLDNQTYASIFIEAGKVSKSNPTHLAARALVETGSGSVGSKSTSGEVFSYDGITYFGLYNYFNIGATSGENAVYRGLVFASGGSDEVIVKGEERIEKFLNSLGYKVNGSYLSGFILGEKINTFISQLAGYDVVVKNNGIVVSLSTLFKTGDLVYINSILESREYYTVVYGDLNADGIVNSADLLKLKQHLLGISLGGAFKSAGDVTKDGIINSADLLRVRQHLLGTNLINQ